MRGWVVVPQLTGRDTADLSAENAQGVLVGWQSIAESYPSDVRARVDAVMQRGGLTLSDLTAMTLAEHERTLERRKRLPSGALKDGVMLTQLAVQIRRQLHQLVSEAGGGVDPDAPVPVPADVDEALREREPDYEADLTDD